MAIKYDTIRLFFPIRPVAVDWAVSKKEFDSKKEENEIKEEVDEMKEEPEEEEIKQEAVGKY